MSAPSFVLIAGETSGDLLGADLMTALAARFPGARFAGVCGPRMQAAGCEPLAQIDELSLFGIAEVLLHLPRLFRLRARLFREILALKPAAVIGIDAPSFNLGLEWKLRRAGLKTVHYVSPTIWAWRQKRVHGIKQAVDLMLTLFPFEAAFYRQHQVPVRYVGHPLADVIPLQADRDAARLSLGLPSQGKLLALLPGSRGSEVSRLAPTFVATARWLAQREPQLRFVAPMATPRLRAIFERALLAAPELNAHLVDGQSHAVLAACDVALLASGTAALEALLFGRPMVVTYRLAPFTHWLLRGVGLLKVQHVSLPNHLTTEPVVPELVQHDAVPEKLGPALLELLHNPASAARQTDAFVAAHQELRRNASATAAAAIGELIGQ
ncbi:MAG: lipid-A-disaccharide synthase [Nevskiales bacterium]